MKGLIFSILVLFLVATFFIGQQIYENDLENKQPKRDIYNLTSSIKWDSNFSYQDTNYYFDVYDITSKIRIGRLRNIIYKFTDFIGYTGIEIAKFGVEFGYTHPQYDFKFYFDLIRFYIVALIVLAIIPVLIPLIALITLLIMGIIKLIKKIKEKSKKEVKS